MTVRDRVWRAVARAPVWALLLFGLSGVLLLVAYVAAEFPMLGEAGYGDSYILYDVEQLRRTGAIHRDPGVPPYPPAQYSPLVYMVLALPGRIVETANPFLGPRAVILLAFAACVAIAGSIAGTLIPVRRARAWGMLLASAIGTMPEWVLQLRADFLGAAFGLLSVRLLLASGRWAALLAGAAAGAAFQFKITFVAALAAGGLWLLVLRRWRDLAHFTAAGVVFGLGPYLYFQLREPQTITALMVSDSIARDYGGLVRLALASAWQPVCLLALAGLPLALRRGESRWWLVLLFAATSLSVALLTGVHAGSNRNYFFEGLFALTPIAALAAVRLPGDRAPSGLRVAGLLAAGLLVSFAVENVAAARNLITARLSPASRLAERRPIEMLRLALPGHRVLSTVPRIAILTDEPVIMEPYYMAYRQKAGKSDTGPFLARVRRQDFEAVVTPRRPRQYRGIPMVPPDLSSAIAEAYEPFCAPGPDLLVHLPRGAAHGVALGAKLKALGCVPCSLEQDIRRAGPGPRRACGWRDRGQTGRARPPAMGWRWWGRSRRCRSRRRDRTAPCTCTGPAPRRSSRRSRAHSRAGCTAA